LIFVRIRLLILLFAFLSSSILAYSFPAQTTSEKATQSKSKSKSRSKAKSKATRHPKKRAISIRVRRVHRAFVASSDLRPMARQLLEDRTPAAYAGVQRYALRHNDEAGSLAWLAIGYARLLDKSYAQAIGPLKDARAHASELGDYIDYYLGSAYAGVNDNRNAIATLRGFDEKYPDSLLRNDAAVVYGGALLANGDPAEAIRVAEAHRQPVRADIELLLGRAYAASGQPATAVQVLRRLFFTMPLAPEASEAGAELRGLSAQAGIPVATFEEQRVRADLLVRGRRYGDAIEEYRQLVIQAPSTDAPAMKVALASALWHAGRIYEAKQMLDGMPATADESGAQRAYLLLEIARPDESHVEQLLASMRATAPQSPWFAEALRSAGNMYLVKPDIARAASLYLELHDRFPSGKYASYAHWKATWLTYRQGKKDQAKALLEAQVREYPRSTEVVAALYWRARIFEDEHDYGRARAWYLKIVNRYSQYYYADLARERLKSLPADVKTVEDPLLARIPAVDPANLNWRDMEIPPDDLRAQKALLLENGALYDQAVREFQAAASDGRSSWALAAIAHVYQDGGHYDQALRALKRALPGYFGMSLENLPRPVWEGLFPRAYWDDMKRYSSSNQLDPFLVAALVRQESEFNPAAISRASAVGLMQLLPSTGRKMARELRLRGYSLSMLTLPGANLQLGTRYFHQLVDKFNGNIEYALAAYNAGTDRVEDWKTAGNFRDTQEFVESIPFTETREYVQAIMRNAQVYRRLYGEGAPPSAMIRSAKEKGSAAAPPN
jgi:soluble lytic murein transglycosylase